MATFNVNGTDYTFEQNENGTISCSYIQNGESFKMWSAEPNSLPQTADEAQDYLESYTWDAN